MRIRLFGGLEVLSPDGQPVRFTTRKSSLLFASLVLAGRRGHRREQLSEALWPGRGDAQSRNSLRQALVDIRRWFPSRENAAISIEGDQDTIALKAKPEEADVWLFERKFDGGGIADLSAAADLYRGDVLADQTISNGLEEWFEPYRGRYRRKARQLVDRLSIVVSEPGTVEESACEGLADRILASDPTAEPAHRALMRIHALRGHENSALRQFETCRAVLKKQLDAEPEAQTAALAASLQSREPARPRLVTPPAAITPQTHTFPGPIQDRPSVAVLPFQNLSGDAEQEYFADGMVEDIITALAHFRHLYVIARNSSFAYRKLGK